MDFTFLGTSGWEQYPGVWCDCDNCRKARLLGGKNIRANSCAWLTPDCLIDFPPQIFLQARQHNVDVRKAKYLLVTHAHDDHFAPHWLWGRKLYDDDANRQYSPRFSNLQPLHIYGNKTVFDKVNMILEKDPDGYSMEVNLVEPFRKYELEDLNFIGITANHFDHGGRGNNYIIEKNGKTVLYALDSGYFLPEAFDEIKKHKFDLIVLEGTYGYGAETETHCNLMKVEEIYDLFKVEQLLKTGAHFCISHISPHFTPIHDKIAPIMASKGITVTYDGMKINL